MHALFKLNKQKNKPEEEEDFWSDDSNDSDDFWETDEADNVNNNFVKSIAMNDQEALNLNYVNRRRRLRVYENDLKSAVASFIEEQDKLVPAGDRYRNDIIEASTPRGNISPIRRATNIHSGKNRKRPYSLPGGTKKNMSSPLDDGDGRFSPHLRQRKNRHLANFGMIANWHAKTMKKVEGVHAFGKEYITSVKEKRKAEIEAKAAEKNVLNDLLHVSRKNKNLRRRTEYLLSQHPEKQFIKEKNDLAMKSAKILASGSRRDKRAILKLRRFRIQQSVKG